MKCTHNARCRYTHGFYCEDCKTFFPRDSSTYRSGELLSSIHMVLNNINVERRRAGLPEDAEVADMKDRIGIGKKHLDYEDIIEEAEKIMQKHGKDSLSATVLMKAVPIISKETKKTLGMPIKTDWGTDDTRGVFDAPCDIHNVWYDSRVGCLMCYSDNKEINQRPEG